jgi:hypothetical protein
LACLRERRGSRFARNAAWMRCGGQSGAVRGRTLERVDPTGTE